ncbi:hypothetical protein [Sphingomonas pseudosanguinis]|uniref:Uncharacterized protein n=1 Tax=Sphingomonas pseudosanguinis TaxID=413712 RepID=A0A7W6F4P1_9SPHN|nr:hypothetical protein [Sphingomonas pseudosanguinis]MBB3881176.1 hypothetical protein [Sphingomonas pseudosanguinis]MBN3535868.1 hypothetical protein [Sphingomonas pseudosanguinis]
MDTSAWNALAGNIGNLLTLAGTLGGTFLGSWLQRRSALKTAKDMIQIERHKYTQDRLWDVRKEAYTSIIAGLRATAKAANVVNDGFNDGYMHPECGSAWKRDPGSGVIGVEKGPLIPLV